MELVLGIGAMGREFLGVEVVGLDLRVGVVGLKFKVWKSLNLACYGVLAVGAHTFIV